MKRVQHIFMKYKDRYGQPPTYLSDLGNVRLSSSEKQYAKRLLQGIRQRMSRGNPISKEHQQKLLTIIDNDDFENVVMGLNLLEQLTETPQDVYDVLNQGQPITDQDFGSFSSKHSTYIRIFTLGLLAGLGDPWALSIKWLEHLENQMGSGYSLLKIYGIPENIGNLKGLEKLVLFDMNLKYLPESMANLTNLYYLDLGNNDLESLPDWIGDLKSLIFLSFFQNSLEKLPDSMANLTNIEILNLFGNRLKELPNPIQYMTKLETLQVELNEITKLPEWIDQLTQLKFLFLRKNLITELPKEIVELENLKQVSFDYNKLDRQSKHYLYMMDFQPEDFNVYGKAKRGE